ncbi:hypothetical protein Q5P01_011957 [Channa striata]|uniref:Uncharacterized protein n=1 Tax=Channa striata TaxID=64152 RepID=A0AA88MMJ7_CHASR|nr:hypothetical protein Q5P01_011957 [Channa striata]
MPGACTKTHTTTGVMCSAHGTWAHIDSLPQNSYLSDPVDPLSSSPPQDSPQISVCLVRTSSQDVQPSPLLSTARSLFRPPPFSSSHYIFIPACSLNSGDSTSKETAGRLKATPYPPPPLWTCLPTACSSLCLPGLSQGMKPPPSLDQRCSACS